MKKLFSEIMFTIFIVKVPCAYTTSNFFQIVHFEHMQFLYVNHASGHLEYILCQLYLNKAFKKENK